MNVLRKILNRIIPWRGHVFFAGWVACAALAPGYAAEPSDFAISIRRVYDAHLAELSPVRRAHWALRVYRITGDAAYLPLLEDYASGLQQRLAESVLRLSNADARRQIVLELLQRPGKTQKNLRRRQLLQGRLEFVYAHRLLFMLYQVSSLRELPQDMEKKVRDYLKQFPFRRMVLDSAILREHTSEAVNTVFYLKALGLDDFETEFTRTFQAVVMAAPDSETDPVLYENKIYGLTHFMIAASDYYQHPVSAKKFGWILEYFEKNFETIARRTKCDVVAEVGVCFLLAKRPHDPVLLRARQYLESHRDPVTGVLTAKPGTNLNSAEHRNALAFLALSGAEQFYPGPKF